MPVWIIIRIDQVDEPGRIYGHIIGRITMHKRTAFFFEIRVKRAFAVLTRKDVVTPYPYFVLRTPLVLCQRRQVSTQSCSLQYVRGTTQGESGILPRLARTPSTGGQGQIGLPQQIAN